MKVTVLSGAGLLMHTGAMAAAMAAPLRPASEQEMPLKRITSDGFISRDWLAGHLNHTNSVYQKYANGKAEVAKAKRSGADVRRRTPPAFRRSDDNLSKRSEVAFDLFRNGNEDVGYRLFVDIGTPTTGNTQQSLNLMFDTGSSDCWVYGPGSDSSAVSDNPDGHTYFYLGESSTQGGDGHTHSITYGSGTVDLDIYTESISLGGYTVPNQPFGVATSVEASVAAGDFDGILGFGWTSLASLGASWSEVASVTDGLFEPYFTAYFQQGTGTVSDMYETGGTVCLGCDYTPPTGTVGQSTLYDLVYDAYWEVESEGFTLNNVLVTGMTGSAILDSGTTEIIIPPTWADAFFGALGATEIGTSGSYMVPVSSLNDIEYIGIQFNGVNYNIALENLLLGFYDADHVVLSISAYTDTSAYKDPAGNVYAIYGDVFLKSVISSYHFELTGYANGAVSMAPYTIDGTSPYLFVGLGKQAGDSCTYPEACSVASCGPQASVDSSYCSPTTQTYGGNGAYCTASSGDATGASSECISNLCVDNVCSSNTNADGDIISDDATAYWSCPTSVNSRAVDQANSCPNEDTSTPSLTLTGSLSAVSYSNAASGDWTTTTEEVGLQCYYGTAPEDCQYVEGGDAPAPFLNTGPATCPDIPTLQSRDTTLDDAAFVCPQFIPVSSGPLTTYLTSESASKGTQAYGYGVVYNCNYGTSTGDSFQCTYLSSGSLASAGSTLCPTILCSGTTAISLTPLETCMSNLDFSSAGPVDSNSYSVSFTFPSGDCTAALFDEVDSNGAYTTLSLVGSQGTNTLIGLDETVPTVVGDILTFVFTYVNSAAGRKRARFFKRALDTFIISTPEGFSTTFTQDSTDPESIAAQDATFPDASGVVTRKKRAVAAGLVLPSQAQCALGQTACKVGGRAGVYECIDVMTNLDTCGGCPGDARSVDCGSIDNVLGVECQMGLCRVLSCDQGFVPAANGSLCLSD